MKNIISVFVTSDLFLIHQQCEMSSISRLNDIVNILIKAGEGYLISNN